MSPIPILLISSSDSFGWGNEMGEEGVISIFPKPEVTPMYSQGGDPLSLSPSPAPFRLIPSVSSEARETEQKKEETEGEPLKSLRNQTSTELYPHGW